MRKPTYQPRSNIFFMMYQFYCRLYQRTLQGASYALPWRKPELLEGENSVLQIPKILKRENLSHVLIITDKGIFNLGLINKLIEQLLIDGMSYTLYDKTVQNPTVDNIEEALEIFHKNHCQAIIAFGGGSPIDCAKGVGARIVNPQKSILEMKGLLKVKKKLPPVFAVPTTTGTGSEATIAAVISDTKTHQKYQINDIVLIPQYAILDPILTINLPLHITATTGMDALTHAIEAYIGRSNTKETKQLSKEAIAMIYSNIYTTYIDGHNLEARSNMLKASYHAGLAFTRAYIGYIHGIAHAIGGMYGVPHGLANAVVMPYVLEYYGESIYSQLAELTDIVGLESNTNSNEKKAKKFIEAIKALNISMEIPQKLDCIMEKDIPILADMVYTEAHPLYPVPKILSKNQLIDIIQLISK